MKRGEMKTIWKASKKLIFLGCLVCVVAYASYAATTCPNCKEIRSALCAVENTCMGRCVAKTEGADGTDPDSYPCGTGVEAYYTDWTQLGLSSGYQNTAPNPSYPQSICSLNCDCYATMVVCIVNPPGPISNSGSRCEPLAGTGWGPTYKPRLMYTGGVCPCP